MIYEIRVYSPEGKLKKVIDSKKATKKFWGKTAELSYTHKRVLSAKKELKCIACGEKFSTSNYKKAYCTTECMHSQAKLRARRRYAERIIKIDKRAFTVEDGSVRFRIVCAICETLVIRASSHASTCSNSCRDKRRRKLNKEEYARFKRKKLGKKKNKK